MSIFSTGLSGLNAAQNALSTTSNNISNVYTPGYNREVTILGESRADGGVEVNDIQRQFNQYVASQLNAATSKSSALEAYSTQVDQIDSLLADRDAGLAPLMQNFFSSMEDLASAPSDPAARQGVLGATDTLTAQFRSFDGYLQDMQQGINGQIADEVTQINNTTEQLAGINREIILARARTGEAPNGLLNQRDQMVNELSERMDVRLNIQDGKTYNIKLPNGQPLVAGTNHYKLQAMDSPADPQRTVLGYQDSGGNLVALNEDTVTGGTLGGLMDFRAETLDKTQNQIGQLAVSLAMGVNQQHASGVDLDGEQGGALFTFGEPQVYSHAGNTDPGATATASFDEADLGGLRATDYTIRVVADSPGDANGFEVVRKDSGVAVDATFDTNTLSFGGVQVEFQNLNNAQQGDRFEIQPVRRAAGNLESAISDLDKIAASSLVKVGGDSRAIEKALADPVPGNTLTGDTPWTLTVVDAGNGTFTLNTENDTGATGPSFTGKQSGNEIVLDGVTLTLGQLEDGQKVTLGLADVGSGNNENALRMQELQEQSLVGGSASLSGAYGAMVSDVGNRTNIVQVNLDAQQGLTEQLKAVQQSESGVNLDEEAANLIRYQQYYQANAKVIETGRNVIDTILGLRN
ncbi:flagellar hook-associated protein FlgK [Halomonas daqiaonensis]|uniref:Flagellar hook-associated protein 1 n=1 Tax=Halomonas daqiaonensis TaxID=650850 RepID=A0A1H7SSA8_9GAMM|nr:flagellar hook-associated protein FlgK [Halomonas daqiaonensis]SEL74397.1 flagellar hook-associated protein 1 FlgK [Halomonas daqiaonensis]